MKNINIFIMLIFGGFTVLAVLVFSSITPNQEDKINPKGYVTVWGTFDRDTFESFAQEQILSAYYKIEVTYKQKTEQELPEQLIEALASDSAPDLVIFPNDNFTRFKNQIEPFKSETFSERRFRDTFIDAGDIFVSNEEVFALPVWSDPMVMYWNKTIFTNNNIVRPPVYWDEFLTLVPILTQKNDSNNILKSAISFGEFQNVTNAKAILVTLLMQTGNSIVEIDPLGKYLSTISILGDGSVNSMETSLRFFTDFANPLKPTYSWNRSLPSSVNMFLSGDLAVYFGYASEFAVLKKKNPNLNFDVAEMPQIRSDTATKMAYGRVGSVAVLKKSRQKTASFLAAEVFARPEFIQAFSDKFFLPPTRRDLVSVSPKNPYMKIFYDSAIISRTWIDIDPEKTETIFRSAVESIISGRVNLHDASSRAVEEMSNLVRYQNEK